MQTLNVNETMTVKALIALLLERPMDEPVVIAAIALDNEGKLDAALQADEERSYTAAKEAESRGYVVVWKSPRTSKFISRGPFPMEEQAGRWGRENLPQVVDWQVVPIGAPVPYYSSTDR